MEQLFILSLWVCGITTILVKSKIMAGKREFVHKRYHASKVGNMKPSWIHAWWYAMWHCGMCSGFWVAIPIVWLYPVYGFVIDLIVVFMLNWLLHCVENTLFQYGDFLEKKNKNRVDNHT